MVRLAQKIQVRGSESLTLRAFVPSTVDVESRTVEVTCSSGAEGERYGYMEGRGWIRFTEKLSVKPQHLNLERFNRGAQLLDSHRSYSTDSVLGVVVDDSAKIKAGQLSCRIKFRSTPEGSEPGRWDQVWHDIQEGTLRNFSIGYRVTRYEEVTKKGDPIPTFMAVDWEVYELSVVPVPFDAKAQTRSLDSLENGDSFEFTAQIQTHLRTAMDEEDEPQEDGNQQNTQSQRGSEETSGGGTATTTRNQDNPTPQPADSSTPASGGERAAAAPAASSEQGGASTPEQTQTRATESHSSVDRQAIIAEERARVSQIRSMARNNFVTDEKFVEDLIARDLDLAEARVAILQRSVTQAHAQGQTNGARPTEVGDTANDKLTRGVANALEHRLFQGSGGQPELTDLGRDVRGWTFERHCEELLRTRGVAVAGLSPQELIKRAISQSDLPELLTGMGNRRLRKAYDSYPRTYQNIANQQNVRDFREIKSIRASGISGMKEVEEGGSTEETSILESHEITRIKKAGVTLRWTWEAMLGDDLGAWAAILKSAGTEAARYENEKFWTLFIKNILIHSTGSPLFSATHRNVGTGQALDLEGLAAARLAGAQQKGLNKERVPVQFPNLIVPPTLTMDAKKHTALIAPAKTEDVVLNEFQTLNIIEEPILEDAPDGNGASDWFMAANKSVLDIAIYGYLNGMQGPTIMREQASRTLDFEVTFWHAFYAGIIEPIGLWRNRAA